MPEATTTNNEKLYGRVEQFMVDAVDHRKLMESNLIRLTDKMDNMASDVSEIKIQAYKTNGRVNVIEPILDELKTEFKEHKELGIKNETYLTLLWATIAALGTGLIAVIFEQLTKTK